MLEFESFEDDFDDITLIQSPKHSQILVTMKPTSFELDNVIDEEKTKIDQECSSSERETNDGLDLPTDVKDIAHV